MRPSRLTPIFTSGSRWFLLAILPLALCLTTAFIPSSLAQNAEKSARKVIFSTKPNYPDILRHAQVGGLVRLLGATLGATATRAALSREGSAMLNRAAICAGMPLWAR